MNEKGRPPNPFGRGERTIIRPNPGGRLPTPPNQAPIGAPSVSPLPPAAPSSSPLPPPASVTPQPLSSPPQPVVQAPAPPAAPFQPQPHAYAAAPTSPAPEDWISTPARPLPQPPQPPTMQALRVDELVAPNANPILRAAGPLLLLLGRLRVSLARAPFAALMEQVADAINFFERDIRSAGISEQQANSAKYEAHYYAVDLWRIAVKRSGSDGDRRIQSRSHKGVGERRNLERLRRTRARSLLLPWGQDPHAA